MAWHKPEVSTLQKTGSFYFALTPGALRVDSSFEIDYT
jgi:hypothetical protein